MTDPWKEFFTPAPDQVPVRTSRTVPKRILIEPDSLVEDLIGFDKPGRIDRKSRIEQVLNSRPGPSIMTDAMRQLAGNLPERIWVVAESPSAALSFRNALRRISVNFRYVDNHHAVMGLDGATVIMLGNFERGLNFERISQVLKGRRNLDIWVVREWCST